MGRGPCGSGVSWREKLVIHLTSPKGKKKAVESEPMKPVVPKVATIVAKRIAQREGSVVPSVSGFVSKRMLGTKFGLASERLAVMKNRNVDCAATYSSAKKGKFALTGNCERSTESETREFPEIRALLKVDLLEDVNAYQVF